jgi:hypothetical protein
MAVTVEDGLRALREATEFSRSIRIELDAEYLRAIAVVEALPANQSGSDKTWVWQAEDSFQRHYEHILRIPE